MTPGAALRTFRPAGVALIANGLVGTLLISVAVATHTVITANDATWGGTNGWRVYLSSPRHADSRFRGECGWEENINGRHWNYNATHANGAGDGGLMKRGYSVTLSANDRVDGAWININSSNKWGAHAHIVAHTNAAPGAYRVAATRRVCVHSPRWSQFQGRQRPRIPTRRLLRSSRGKCS